ncbi:MAG: hypothetical protein AB7F67_03975 [Rhodospirillaceae bacterium]
MFRVLAGIVAIPLIAAGAGGLWLTWTLAVEAAAAAERTRVALPGLHNDTLPQLAAGGATTVAAAVGLLSLIVLGIGVLCANAAAVDIVVLRRDP